MLTDLLDGCASCRGLPVRGVCRGHEYVMVECEAKDPRREACNDCGCWAVTAPVEACRGCEATLEIVTRAEEGGYCRGCALLLTCHVIDTVGFEFVEERAS
jgi:hypothetical protein